MTIVQAISLFSFAMLSLVDLRARVVPLIEVFFGIAAFLAFPDDRLHVTVLILAVIWGIFRRIPRAFSCHSCFTHPAGPLYLSVLVSVNK